MVNDGAIAAANVRDVPIAERARMTLDCMRARTPLIYGGRLEVDDLTGEPDLLRLEGGGRFKKAGSHREVATYGSRFSY